MATCASVETQLDSLSGRVARATDLLRAKVDLTDRSQDLVVVTRTKDGFEEHKATPVRFVSMTGKAEQR